jgi:hypothetical protein
MSKSYKIVVTLGLVALVAACGTRSNQEEIIIVEPAPVVAEPVYTKW